MSKECRPRRASLYTTGNPHGVYLLCIMVQDVYQSNEYALLRCEGQAGQGRGASYSILVGGVQDVAPCTAALCHRCDYRCSAAQSYKAVLCTPGTRSGPCPYVRLSLAPANRPLMPHHYASNLLVASLPLPARGSRRW